MPGSKGVSVVQDKDADAVVLALETASELGMSRLRACCERHIALNPCLKIMVPKVWQRVPTSSTLRIALCLSRAMNAAQVDYRRSNKFRANPYEHVPSCQTFWEMAKK